MLDYDEHIIPYNRLSCICDERGYIAWRPGSGKTLELLHLDTLARRQGYGTSLMLSMLQATSESGYTVIYGFTRARMIEAQLFYISLGFKLQLVPNLYPPCDGVLFTQPYHLLLDHVNDRRKRI